MLLPLLLAFLLLKHAAPLLSLPSPAQAEQPPATLRFDLVRVRSNNYVLHAAYFRDLVHRDRHRHKMISTLIGKRRMACEQGNQTASFSMPLSSGAYARNGEYFARVKVGTPPQEFLLVVDTGSDLLWVNCRHKKRQCRRCSAAAAPGGRGGERVFRADKSSSFRPVRCSSGLCKNTLPFSLTTCPRSASPCLYNYSYGDGSTAQGIFANETATVSLSNGYEKKIRNLVIGCTAASSGSSFAGSDGVLGLGFSPISFAVRAAKRFGGRFSYCLVDHLSPRNVSNYLVFGPNQSVRNRSARSTPLVLDPRALPFYQIRIVGMSIDGQDLLIPSAVWDLDREGGTIIDSGTTLTFLAEPAYKAVTSALNQRLNGVPTADSDPFEYCYNWTTAEAAAVEARGLPKLVVHLEGSARLEPPAKSYVIDVEPGVKCLGFQVATWPGQSTIGNILQQEHLWEFDIRNQRLRFQRSRCVIRR